MMGLQNKSKDKLFSYEISIILSINYGFLSLFSDFFRICCKKPPILVWLSREEIDQPPMLLPESP